MQQRLDQLWRDHFSDIERINSVKITFGRKAKRRFGSIKMGLDQVSHITINGIFKYEIVPEAIVLATIAHELCHYVHGFGSPRPKKYKHPHRGGVILKELRARGLEHLHEFEQSWSKKHWPRFCMEFFPQKRRRKPKVKRRVLRRSVKSQNLSFLELLTGLIREKMI